MDDHRLVKVELDAQLESSRAAADELSRQLVELEGEHATLKSEHGTGQWDLSRARTTVQQLEERVRVGETSIRELGVTVADKERLLRDQRGEAELDRAVLENELADLRRIVDDKAADVVAADERVSTLEDVAKGLREQIARWELISVAKESEVGLAKGEAEEARREREVGIVAVQRELVVATRTARAALKFAGELRDDNNKITAVLSAPTPAKSDSSSDNVDKPALASTSPQDVGLVEPPEVDYALGDLEDLLDAVQRYDHDALTEAVKTKIEGLTSMSKKWSKEAKAYRERAHRAASGASDKIAFRKCVRLFSGGLSLCGN